MKTKQRLTSIAWAMALAGVVMYSAGSQAQTTGAVGVGQSASDAGAMASTGAITFEAAEQRRHTTIDTTPNVYAPPSMFGGANNCGMSDTLGLGVSGFGIGGSRSSESKACNAREDTAIAAKLGYMDVAQLRFFCFGEEANRMAYEAAGHVCPSSGTAKGIEGAPTGPKFLVAPTVQRTLRGRINPDGTITQQ